MKEATGELNMTVITVVAIAAVAAFFYAFVWPAIKNNITSSQYCTQSWDCDCSAGADTCTCKYCKDGGFDCTSPDTVQCPNKAKDSSGGGSETPS